MVTNAGDTPYQPPDLHGVCALQGRTLIAAGRTAAPADNLSKPLQAIFHALRHIAAENLNELLKNVFGLHGAVPTTGRLASQC